MAILFCLIFLSVNADPITVDIGGINYDIDVDNNIASVGVNKDFSGACDIVSSVKFNGVDYPVKSIGSNAFYNCTELTSVKIPNSVTEIGICAFYGCSKMKDVLIGNSVSNIGMSAFNGCEQLNSVYLPSSICSIGDYAFLCGNLNSIEVDDSNAYYTDVDGILYSKDMTELCVCPGGRTSVKIPNYVKTIGRCAFAENTNLTYVDIPESVTSIAYRAFEFCSGLTSLLIPDSVTYIGTCSFTYCTGLKSIIIGNSVTEIGQNAFSNCIALNYLKLGPAVSRIGTCAFSYCVGLTSVVIPSSTTSIGYGAFDGCKGLTSFVIPNSVITIGGSAFGSCFGLKEVDLPNSLSYIGDWAFSGCISLSVIRCRAVNPPEIQSHTFTESTYKDAKLIVPDESVGLYSTIGAYWPQFNTILGMSEAGVDDVAVDDEQLLPIEYYRLDGVKVGDNVDCLAPGLYLKRQGGKTGKMIVR